jgi:hypothetical protein
MPGALLHVGATVLCPHMGPVSFAPVSSRVLLSGQPAVTVVDDNKVAGCSFNVSGSPHPCVTVRWTAPAARVLVGGQPAALATSAGLGTAADQLPQGFATVAACQLRAVGT